MQVDQVVVLVSADTEWRAVKEILSPGDVHKLPLGEWFDLFLPGLPAVHFFHGGWGKVSAAATAQYCLDQFHPRLLINLGTCGGFAGRIKPGTVILVDRTIIYDIIEQMSDPEEALAYYTTDLDLSWLLTSYPHPVQRGILLSADRDILPADIPVLIQKYGAVAADWESGAIAWVASKNGVRCLILRGVSDLVSPDGGEAYGKVSVFNENTKAVMGNLLSSLPDWLALCGEGRKDPSIMDF